MFPLFCSLNIHTDTQRLENIYILIIVSPNNYTCFSEVIKLIWGLSDLLFLDKHIINSIFSSVFKIPDYKLAWCYLSTVTQCQTDNSTHASNHPQSRYFTLHHASMHTWLLLATRISCVTHMTFVYLVTCLVYVPHPYLAVDFLRARLLIHAFKVH